MSTIDQSGVAQQYAPKTSNLAQELEDALLIIKHDQGNTNAYLRAANVYSTQGKQREAISMLEKGLNTSPSDQQVKLLQQRITMAKSRLNRRVDFITKAPYDIACHIIGLLDLDHDIKECMDVSSAWRTVISQCPYPWKSFTHHKSSTGHWIWNDPSVLQDIIPLISRHIKTLAVYSHNAQYFMNFFKTCDFSRLRYLQLHWKEDDHLPISLLYASLDTMGRTLKELDLTIPEIHIGQLLSSCPNLSTLTLHVRNTINWRTQESCLETFKIVSTEYASAGNIEGFLYHTPHLRHLDLRVDHDTEHVMWLLNNYCPELITFRNSFLYRPDTAIPYRGTPKNTSGLSELSLGGIQSILPLSERLQRSANTLWSISLGNIFYDSTTMDWRTLSLFTMHQLAYLGITTEMTEPLGQLLPDILRVCPNLESLYLNLEIDGSLNLEFDEPPDALFDAIAELNHLTNLNLHNTGTLGNGGASRFIHHCNTRSGLKELSIVCSNMDHSLLQNVARIDSLQHLNLHIREVKHVPGHVVLEFTRLIGQLPRLAKLDIGKMELNEYSARNIAKSRSLERLTFVDSSYFDIYNILKHLVSQ